MTDLSALKMSFQRLVLAHEFVVFSLAFFSIEWQTEDHN